MLREHIWHGFACAYFQALAFVDQLSLNVVVESWNVGIADVFWIADTFRILDLPYRGSLRHFYFWDGR
jgi:hypothetical protein